MANQIAATVNLVKLGNIMSVDDVELISALTRGSAEHPGLKEGDTVKAVNKATEILIDKP